MRRTPPQNDTNAFDDSTFAIICAVRYTIMRSTFEPYKSNERFFMRLSVNQIAEYAGGVVVCGNSACSNSAGAKAGNTDAGCDANGDATSSPAGPARDASGDSADVPLITSVTWDSRKVSPGSLYVALIGQRADGHTFVPGAFEAGAQAALISEEPTGAMLEVARAHSAALIRVQDTQAAFTRLAARWRAHLKGRVIGLTGSVGKTTTKNLIRDVLASRIEVVATQKNQNNELGVPNTILHANPETQAVIVEMGMRGLGEIAQLCEIAVPDWGVVTHVGECHTELLGSVENVARAKAELPQSLGGACAAGALCGETAGAAVGTQATQTSYAFLNAADEYFDFIKEISGVDARGVVCVMFDGSPDAGGKDYATAIDTPIVWATDIELNAQGQPSFLLHVKNFEAVYDGVVDCALTLRGAHNVSNACAAAAVAAALGFSVEEICAALSAAQPEEGRQEILSAASGFTVINDAYNANPDSMCAALHMLASMQTSGARIAVLGDMWELGSVSAQGHARAGRLAADLGIDYLICVGDMSVDIYNGAKDFGMRKDKMAHVQNAQEAHEILKTLVQPEDIVLVKASHAMHLDELAIKLVE